MKKVLLLTLALTLIMTGVVYGWDSQKSYTCTQGSTVVSRTYLDNISTKTGEKIRIRMTADGTGDLTVCPVIPISGWVAQVVFINSPTGNACAANQDYTFIDIDGKEFMSDADLSPQLTNLAADDLQFLPTVGGSKVARYVDSFLITGDEMGATNVCDWILYIYREIN